MVTWLVTLFTAGYGSLAQLANAVRQAFVDFFNGLVQIFVSWVNSAHHLVNAMQYTYGGAVDLLVSLMNLGRRIVTVYVPNLVNSALDAAHKYAEWIAGTVLSTARVLFREAVDAAQSLANSVYNFAYTQIHNLIDVVNNVIGLLNTVAKRVFALLTNPRALADWMAGEIVGAVYRWALGSAEALARLAFNLAVSGAIKFAGVLEHVISDVFM